MSQYQVTTDFVFMINSTTLHVYDGENDQFLIRGFTSYFVADSIIGFEDVLARKYFLYTNGVIFPLVDDIVHNPIQVVAAGDNIVCYKSADDSFRIFYHNQYYTLRSIYADSVKASKNIVAYTDHYDDLLRIFFRDHEIIPEKFPVTDLLMAVIWWLMKRRIANSGFFTMEIFTAWEISIRSICG
jgi:hypothetical protein